MGMVASIVKGAGQAAAGFVEGGFTAIAGSKAAKRAANAQQAAADQASAMQGKAKTEALTRSAEAEKRARADYQPYNAAGQRAIGGLESGLAGLQDLVTNPESQKAFITNNPFFDALAKRSSDTLFSNMAAKGKVGSGGTAEALQNSILLLGSDLLNQNIIQRQNTNAQFQDLVSTGLTAAGGQAGVTQNMAGIDIGTTRNTATQQGEYRTQSGNAQAGGIIGAYNARNAGNIRASQGALQGLTTVADSFGAGGGGSPMGGNIGLCDKRAKTNIKQVGYLNNGLPVYTFEYKGKKGMHMNVMAQDVEKVNPSAVIEINGLKHINMEAACL